MKNLALDGEGHAVEADLPLLTPLINPGEEIEIVSLSVTGSTTDQAMLESMSVNGQEVHRHHLRLTEGELTTAMTAANEVRIGQTIEKR